MSLSDDIRKMGNLYCENLGLGPQANPSLNPATDIPTVVKQTPDETLKNFKTFFQGIQCPKMRKKIVLELLDSIL